MTASALFDMICAEPTYRVDGVRTATRGVLDQHSLQRGLVVLQDMNILSVPPAANRDSVHFWRRALAHGWKQFLPLNLDIVDSARATAAAFLESKAKASVQQQTDIALRQEEAALKNKLMRIEIAQKEAQMAQLQAAAPQKQEMLDIEIAPKKAQTEIQRIKVAASEILADAELAKAEQAVKNP